MVSVIMPTRALPERAALLRRALESVLAQQCVHVAPIVVINGTAADPSLVRELRADRLLRVVALERADLPAALCAGRALVDTPFFAALDDDDLLLPGALAARVAAVEAEPGFDAVVSNGLRRDLRRDVLHLTDITRIERDPVGALPRSNWLLPGSWLCRSEKVGPWLFEGMPQYLECTYLALRLATRSRLQFLDEPTVIWHVDTPASVSRSRDYILGQVPALLRILELDMPAGVRTEFRAKLSYACHAIAYLHLTEGAVGKAWSWHLRSLREPRGWRHLPFTRKLLRPPPTT
ncbi:MAG: glycosyltransferase family 2 protein [Longimicrobiales bacterium]